jgi:hypothetical protein
MPTKSPKKKINSYYPDQVAKMVVSLEKWQNDEISLVRNLVSMWEVRPLLTKLAEEIGSSKLEEIASSVFSIEDQREREGSFCRRQITDKQRVALATALLEKYRTAREIVKSGWSLTDQEIDDFGES